MVVPCLAYLLAKHTTTNVPLEKVTWLSGLVVCRADLTDFEIVGVGVDCRISACHHTFAKARRRQGKIHICTASIHHVSQLPEGNYSPAKEIRRKKTHMQGTESGHRKEKKPGTWDTCTSDYCKRLMKKEYTATCSRSQDLWNIGMTAVFDTSDKSPHVGRILSLFILLHCMYSIHVPIPRSLKKD